jgi:hypothetical protein
MNNQFAIHILNLLGGERALCRAIGPTTRFTALVGAAPGLRIESMDRRSPVTAEIVFRGRGTYAVDVSYAQGAHVAQHVGEDGLALAIPVLTGWRLPLCPTPSRTADPSIVAMAF